MFCASCSSALRKALGSVTPGRCGLRLGGQGGIGPVSRASRRGKFGLALGKAGGGGLGQVDARNRGIAVDGIHPVAQLRQGISTIGAIAWP
jgi:hypothetical protein